MSLLAARQAAARTKEGGEGGETGTICQEGRNSQASKGMMMIDEAEYYFFFACTEWGNIAGADEMQQ